QIKEAPLTNTISIFITFPATFLLISVFPNPNPVTVFLTETQGSGCGSKGNHDAQSAPLPDLFFQSDGIVFLHQKRDIEPIVSVAIPHFSFFSMSFFFLKRPNEIMRDYEQYTTQHILDDD